MECSIVIRPELLAQSQAPDWVGGSSNGRVPLTSSLLIAVLQRGVTVCSRSAGGRVEHSLRCSTQGPYHKDPGIWTGRQAVGRRPRPAVVPQFLVTFVLWNGNVIS